VPAQAGTHAFHASAVIAGLAPAIHLQK